MDPPPVYLNMPIISNSLRLLAYENKFNATPAQEHLLRKFVSWEMEVYIPEDAFGMNLQTFKFFGIWPSSVKHPLLRTIYKSYGYAIHLFYIAAFLPTQFISMYIMRGDLKNLVDSSFFALTCVGYTSKIVVLILRREVVEGFFKRLQDPIFAPRQQKHFAVWKNCINVAKISSMIFMGTSLTTCATWIIYPLVDSKQEKMLLFAAWYPYNVTVNPAYAYTYVSQTFLLLTTASMNCMIDGLTTNFYVVMVGQMEILKQDFRQLTDFTVVKNWKDATSNICTKNSDKCKELYFNQEEQDEPNLTNLCNTNMLANDTYSQLTIPSANVPNWDKKSVEKVLNDRIIKCTLRYQAILKFVNDVTNFFQIGIIVQVCVSSIILCTTTYEMTSIPPNTLQFYVVIQYQICVFYQIFMYTWRGNNITVKTSELKDAVYECGWMSLPNKKFRKSLCIIMSPLQVPLTLCVGKFFLLSVDTFIKILKLAYSFYVVLKQMNSGRK